MQSAELSKNAETINAGQAYIEDDQVKRVFLSPADCFFAVMRHHRVMTSFDQRGANVTRNPGFIVNNENAHGSLAAENRPPAPKNDAGKVTGLLPLPTGRKFRRAVWPVCQLCVQGAALSGDISRTHR